MQDYFLRCTSEKTLNAKLIEAGVLVGTKKDGYYPTVELSIIGPIYEETGVVDADGLPITEPIEGYHANIRGNLTQEQIDILPIIPRPNNPHRVFAS